MGQGVSTKRTLKQRRVLGKEHDERINVPINTTNVFQNLARSIIKIRKSETGTRLLVRDCVMSVNGTKYKPKS